MENLRGRGGRAPAGAPGESSRQITYEEFQPSFDWTHDSINHVLLVDLSGFAKEDLKVQVDSLGKLTISGERKEGEGKYRRFKKVFDVPSDSNIDKISGKFEHGLLFLIMPLKEVGKEEEKPKPTQKQEPKKEDAAIGKESLKKEEKPTQKQEPEKEDAAIGKESLKKEEKPTQKQEPKNEDAAIGKESTKKEEKPTQKQEPKKEDAAIGKESTKKEEKPTEKEKEKPKREDSAIGKDGTKKEEKPIHSHKEEPKKDDGAIGKDGTKKEEKPMLKLKEEAKKEDGVRTKKIEAEGDNHVQRDKKDRGIVDNSIKQQEERGSGRRREEREAMAMAMAMEGEEEEEDSERCLFQTVVEQINKNKAVIVVAALAFSFGVYLSRKLR